MLLHRENVVTHKKKLQPTHMSITYMYVAAASHDKILILIEWMNEYYRRQKGCHTSIYSSPEKTQQM